VIVVDTSIVVAIMRSEPERAAFEDVLDDAPAAIMSVVSYVETHMVIAGRRSDASFRRAEHWFEVLGIEIVPVTPEQGVLAVAAFLHYGKGRHPAALIYRIVLPTRSPSTGVRPCSSKATTFCRPTSYPRGAHRAAAQPGPHF